MKKTNNHTVLSLEEELALFKKYRENGDLSARDELICSNANLVRSIASKALVEGVEFDDLVSEGYIGLMNAVERFDYTLGYKFSTYAHWWITKVIYMYIMDNDRSVRLPASTHKRIIKIKRFISEYEEAFHRTPSHAEIAAALDLPEENVKLYLASTNRPISLQESITDEDETIQLGDIIASKDTTPDAAVEYNDFYEQFMEAVNSILSPRENHVIRFRYGLNGAERKTLDAIGHDLGMTREGIRRIEKKALKKLKKHLEKLGFSISDAA